MDKADWLVCLNIVTGMVKIDSKLFNRIFFLGPFVTKMFV